MNLVEHDRIFIKKVLRVNIIDSVSFSNRMSFWFFILHVVILIFNWHIRLKFQLLCHEFTYIEINIRPIRDNLSMEYHIGREETLIVGLYKQTRSYTRVSWSNRFCGEYRAGFLKYLLFCRIFFLMKIFAPYARASR